MTNLGLLALHVGLGLVLAAHGAQKLFGWFGGAGIDGTTQFFGSLGFRPARFWAIGAGLAEFVGGLLTALGLFGPVGPALILIPMLTAIAVIHWSKGFWNSNGGMELPATNSLIALALALTGFGEYALDEAFGISLTEPSYVVAALIIALLAAAVSTMMARRAEPQPTGAPARA